MINISAEDVKKIKEFIAVRDSGKLVSSNEVTSVLNRVKGVYLSSTNCASCIRARINELERYLHQFEAATALETPKVEEHTTQEEKPLETLENKPKRGRKKKSE